MAKKCYSTTSAKGKVVITKNNKKEMNRVLRYLSKGDGAQAPQPIGGIIDPEDYRTHSIDEAGKVDAILVISKDNHLMSEKFPDGVPIYQVTFRSNREDTPRPQELRGILRVPGVRPKKLVDAASELMMELLPERLGVKNIAVYCDFPLLAAQMLKTNHRLFIAEHKMPVKTVEDYEYSLRAFVTSVVESREQRGRAIGDALWRRPALRDGAMRAVIKKFGRLLDEEDLKVMGFEKEFIDEMEK